MGLHLLHIVTFVSVAIVASNAALSSEAYWNSVLPNTPMPKAISDLLPTSAELVEDGSTSVKVTSKGVGVDTVNQEKYTDVGVDKGGVGVETGGLGKHTDVGVGKGGVSVDTGAPGKNTGVSVGKGGVFVNTGKPGKPVFVGVHPGFNPFEYYYAASEDQIKDNPNIALFFLEKDLRGGTNMNLHFTKSTSPATFLPRQVAEKIPFSSDKLPQILNQFSVKPNSAEADIMKSTIAQCEKERIGGEEKYCATSLESMINFSTSKLGKKVLAVSTEVKERTILQPYTIVGVKKLGGDKAVVCHKQDYAYAVFYCHKTTSTKAYRVFLAGANGANVKAVAVCHTDTATWNPKHLAFQVLKVKPGTVPICHFLPEDHIVWIPY